MIDQDKELLERFRDYILVELKRIRRLSSEGKKNDYKDGVEYGILSAERSIRSIIDDFVKHEDKEREKYFTLGEIRRMTPDQVKQNIEKFDRSLRRIAGLEEDK